MISVIVCSVNKSFISNLRANIIKNIGCNFELLIHDNTLNTKGICTVYNNLAANAKGKYLCFLHEDVLVLTEGWGNILITKASEESTGVIGFAGSETVSGIPYWHYKETLHYHYRQTARNGSLIHDFTLDGDDEKHENIEVAVLDGMFLFCRKEIWEKNKFDENSFSRFHLYDIDFTFQVAQKLHNYVNTEIILVHSSLGSLNMAYYKNLIIFYKKWRDILPFTLARTNPHNMDSNGSSILYRVAFEILKKANLPIQFMFYYLKAIGLLGYPKDYFIVWKCILKTKCKKIVGR
jgi:hypothetical protein